MTGPLMTEPPMMGPVTLFGPVTLTGNVVELRPMRPDDRDGLVAAASDGELWHLFYTRVPSPDSMASIIAEYLADPTMLQFTIRRIDTGEVVGATSYCHIDVRAPRVEIGYTWLAASAQGTHVNAEAKLLLLTHAFDELGCLAVEFRTHWLNQASRRAIERLGAKQDGVLRCHQRMPDGTVRDTVVYSITAGEWPAVRNELGRRLS